jgi:hypothetical protein
MTVFRATFTVEKTDGKTIDDDTVRSYFTEALEDVTEFFATDDNDREGEYAVTLDSVE